MDTTSPPTLSDVEKAELVLKGHCPLCFCHVIGEHEFSCPNYSSFFIPYIPLQQKMSFRIISDKTEPTASICYEQHLRRRKIR